MYNPVTRISIGLIILLLCSSISSNAQTRFVKTGANGSGASWADASGDLRSILATANPGTQVWVAAGTYRPTNCTSCTFADRNTTFTIPEGVQVYGGFQGGETMLAERNPSLNPTILSGDIDSDGTAANNSYCVVFTAYVTNATLMDGFIIQDGYADNNTVANGEKGNSGGGWFNKGNLAGGSSHPVIRNCTFRNNYAFGYGGGMFNEANFSGHCSPKLENCLFENNSSKNGGGGIYFNAILGGESYPELNNCTFRGNTCENSGGAMFNNGQSGTCIPAIVNCQFFDNRINQYGGAMYNLGKDGVSSPRITNCIFYDNIAVAAGAIYNLGSQNGNSSPVITNCTFYKNSANVGAVMYNQANDPSGTCEAQVTNCIFWGNVAGSGYGMVFQNGYANPTISYSLIQLTQCSDLNTGINSTVNCGPGNIFGQDPLFRDAANYNLRLQEHSPAKDAGNNLAIQSTGIAVDLDSLPRVHNSTVDIGAFEYGSTSYQTPEIVQHPSGMTICENEQATLSIIASGTPPLQYQWFKNGSAVNGSTTNSLLINTASLTDNGTYHCRIIGSMQDTINSEIATLAVNENVQSSISINTDDNPACEHTNLLFTSSIDYGGSSPSFQWFKNNTPISGATAANYSANALTDGSVISCRLTSSEACLVNNPVMSNELTVSVLDEVVAAISITASSQSVCAGESIDFSANIQNGGSDPRFQWYRNGEAIPGAAAADFSIASLIDGDEIYCKLESNAVCVTNPVITSNAISVEVAAIVMPSISISTAVDQICEGEEQVFMAQVNFGGANPNFIWYINGAEVSTNGTATFSTTVLSDNDEIQCMLQSNHFCIAANNIVSNTLSANVLNIVTPGIDIETSATEICASESVTIHANISNGGINPVFAWYVNGNLQAENSASLELAGLADGTQVHSVLTSDGACTSTNTATSNELRFSVVDEVEAAVYIETSASQLCRGELVQFDAQATHPGASPVFKWYINDDLVGGVSTDIFSVDSLKNGDVVRCELFSSAACVQISPALSNIIEVTVNELEKASISLVIPNDSICKGTEITFDTETTNSGNTPSYQWFWNEQPVGIDEPSFFVEEIFDGDQVYCLLTPDLLCAESSPVSSDTLTIAAQDCTTAVYTPENRAFWEVFPNPTKGSFIVTAKSSQDGELLEAKLFTARGDCVYSNIHSTGNSYEVYGLPAGMYWLQLKQNHRQQLLKIILLP